MDRRDFLKLTSAVGLTAVAPSAYGGRDLSFGRQGLGAAGGAPFFVQFNAGGGWDPTSFCDPKGFTSENDPDPMNQSYAAADIVDLGAFRVAPVTSDPDGNPAGVIVPFFDKYKDKLFVLNGIDMLTNGHDTGTRHTWTGRLAEGMPAIGAFMAATYDPTLPMAYLAFGGFTNTEGICAKTRAGNVNVLQQIALPDRINIEDENSTFHSSKTQELMEEAQWWRDNALLEGQRLPRIRESINSLFVARSGSNELIRLLEFLPDPLSDDPDIRQAEVAVSAYRAGIALSASIGFGGFDTHGNHDASQIPSLERFFSAVDKFMIEAERQGCGEDVVVAMGSDFGRTPGYNDGNGKDHWPISSAAFMGKGIPGGKLIGATDERHNAYGIDPSNFAIDQSEEAPRLEVAHWHIWMRKLHALGAENPLAQAYPLVPDVDLDLSLA